MKFGFYVCFFSLFSVGAYAETTVDDAWLKLLHYQPVSDGYQSVVDNQEFFLSEEGRYYPQRELDYTIKVFNDEKNIEKCNFPARFLYLKKRGLVHGDLKDCKDYQSFLNDIQPKAVTMLFTNAYMSNPSSLFGHTLFRIDTKRKGTQLLAHGANFGADTGDESGVLYALKGLWGGYFGTFGIKPYYDVINLYNNIENRDIWEYELNLSEAELNLFTAHVWEMKNAKIKYYFASKNCSYVLLLMLEAVRPDLNLSGNFTYYTVPLATLKAIDKVPNFIVETNYRPSRQTKLKYRAKQMNKKQYRAFIDIIKRNNIDVSALNKDEIADVLETAYQYIQYQYVEGTLELRDYRQKSFALLKERSRIVSEKSYFNEKIEGENPIEAHEAQQIGGYIGSQNGRHFQEISFKPIYNSLLEDSYGLLSGAEIGFLETKIRHYDDENEFQLKELDILSIKSLSGADDMFMPFSYDIKVAYEELFDSKKDDTYGALNLELGIGQSYAFSDELLMYVMSVPNLVYSGGVKHNGYLGIGLKSGFYLNHDKWRLNASVTQNVTTARFSQGQNYHLEGAYGLTRNSMIYTSYKFFNSDYHDNEEISFGLKFSF